MKMCNIDSAGNGEVTDCMDDVGDDAGPGGQAMEAGAAGIHAVEA
jgi:hypothetical protein